MPTVEHADNKAQDIRTIRIARQDILWPFLDSMGALQQELAALSQAEAALTQTISGAHDLAALEGYFHRQAELTAQKLHKQEELNRKRAGAEAFYKFIAARLAERDEQGAPGPAPTGGQLYRALVEDAPLHYDKLVIS